MPKISDEELLKIIEKAIVNYSGTSDKLESAVGALHLGRHMGWKPLYLLHTRSTVKAYEKILGIEFRNVLDEETKDSPRSVAYIAVQKVSNFWKAVKGEIEGIRSQEITQQQDKHKGA